MRRHPRVARLVFLLCATLLLGALPWANRAEAQTIIEGSTGPGSVYGLARPDVWNGDLVVYAHQIIDPDRPVALPSDPAFLAFRTAWLQAGFAVAYSSFSDNGYALKDGAQRTHQLRGLFASSFGQPGRTFLVGASLGGLIALQLAERFPSQYDAALAACAPVGGTRLQFDYIANTRVLFDYFYPELQPLIGTALDVPSGIPFPGNPPSAAFQAAAAAVAGGFVAPPFRSVLFGRSAGLPGADPLNAPMLGDAIIQSLGFSVRFTNNILGLTHGKNPFDNRDTVYSTNTGNSALDALLNASVQRYAADPSAVNYMQKYYTPTGDLQIPVLTLHTTLDPLVPFFHEAAYQQAVQAAGAGDYLAQRGVTAYGHCNFTPAQMQSAFSALVAWASGGPKPASGVLQ